MAQALQSSKADLALGLISSLETGFYQQTLCTCCRHYSGAAAGWMVSLGSPAVSAFPERAIRSTCALSISRLARRLIALRPAACTLVLSPIRNTLIEGFSHFVTSMTAPIASGWSGCRVGLAPTGKRRLCTAHTQLGHRDISRLIYLNKRYSLIAYIAAG